MPTYRELLAAARAAVREIAPEELRDALARGRPIALVDVREGEEWSQGHLPGAVHVPRGFLESRIEAAVPDRAAEVVLYCAGGARSALAARTLAEMGYGAVSSLAGGYGRWTDRAFPTVKPGGMTPEQRERYRRHIVIPEVGEAGQARLLASKVLLLGAGGLGSPAALYLAAAGVGTIGVVDSDVVDLSNLQRQVLHSTRTLGQPKTASAADALRALNPDVKVVPFQERLTSENVLRILDGFDLVVDGGDNFPTRYLLNDASVLRGLPVVHGSVYRFEGQVTVFWPGKGPCYRCLYPRPPPPELAPSCAEAGVLGVLPGVVGLLQANEALKILLGKGDPLVGRLVAFDALASTFHEVRARRDPACPVCRPGAEIRFVDYEGFCAAG
ncbi:MAG TPA: molybdopterin-synthase adenylyltransferase MoeB [Anaeromyxobacteraceae bacterium]|nr:molybdopterin-synthase adenylyltransferase MoeB [Anaeromyxobacteraceae bacterium]